MRGFKSMLGEGLVVLMTGLVFALIANAVSPKGLSFTRDYFKGAGTQSLTNQVAAIGTNAASALSVLEVRLKEKGIGVVSSNEVIRLFKDPGYQQGLILFIDARDDQRFQEGHVPGAYQLDHYRPINYLPNIMPFCMTAQRVVVYCTGGNCEDSEFAAILLKDSGVAAEKLVVYPGGINEWMSNGLPVQQGGKP